MIPHDLQGPWDPNGPKNADDPKDTNDPTNPIDPLVLPAIITSLVTMMTLDRDGAFDVPSPHLPRRTDLGPGLDGGGP